MNGAYSLPMKVTNRWAWEHAWLAFTVLGVAGVPTVLAIATVPDLWAIYESVPPPTLVAMAAFGVGWGVAMVLFGLALALVGVAITFAVCLGTSSASGALIPLLAKHPERLLERQGLAILAGVALIALGVGLCGVAGHRRERMKAAAGTASRASTTRGVFYAVVSGVLGSMLNFGLAFGQGIQQAARDHGAVEAMTSNAVWLPCLYAGFIPGVVYCLYLMKKNGRMADLLGQARWYYWGAAILMGILWYGSVVVYSMAASKLGELGPSIAWPLFMSAAVLVSTVAGVVTGEWKGASRGSMATMAGGILCLILAIAVLARAG